MFVLHHSNFLLMMHAYHYVITMVYFSYWHLIAKHDHLNSKPGLLCLYWSELCCMWPFPVVFCCCCDPIMSCLGHFGCRLKRCINPSVIPVYFKIKGTEPFSIRAEIQRVQKGRAAVLHQKTWPESNQALVSGKFTLREGRAPRWAGRMRHEGVTNEPNWTITASTNSLCLCICGDDGSQMTFPYKPTDIEDKDRWNPAKVLFPLRALLSDSLSASGSHLFRLGMLKQNTCGVNRYK